MPTLSSDDARAFLAQRHWGVLATIKHSDGRPQLSNVGYALIGHDVRISITVDRAKAANVRRDPRVSLHVTSDDFWTYVVAEGNAQLSEVATEPGDATCRALLELYEAIAGSHDNPEAFFEAMVSERRVQLSLHPERLYPTA